MIIISATQILILALVQVLFPEEFYGGRVRSGLKCVPRIGLREENRRLVAARACQCMGSMPAPNDEPRICRGKAGSAERCFRRRGSTG